MAHLCLLGDSIFDNAAYVGGGPDVVTQLRAALPTGWKATLLAVDGAVIVHLVGQAVMAVAMGVDDDVRDRFGHRSATV